MSSSKLILPMLILLGLLAGCESKKSEPDPSEKARYNIQDSSHLLVEDVILLEFNKLLNKWEVAQSYSDPEIKHFQTMLEEWALTHFHHLMYICGSGSPAELLVAAPALGFSHKEEAIPVLIRLFEHPSADVVANAALGLGILGDTSTSIEPVVLLLNHDDPNVRSKAGFVLTHILAENDSRGALNPLLVALKDDEIWVKVNCLNALAVVKDRRAVVPILKHCIGHRDPRVRFAAASTLGSIAYLGTIIEIKEEGILADSPVPYLIKLLEDENVYIKDAAHWALRRIAKEEIDPDMDMWLEWYTNEQVLEMLRYADKKRRASIQSNSGR